MGTFRILSLDGGGIKGTFTAAVLAEVEAITGKRVVDHFDLIAGTSTGGIIAVALGLGVPAGEILKFYETAGPRVFPSTGLHRRIRYLLRHIVRPKHSQEVLRHELTAVLGDRRLGASKTRLVLTSYDAIRGDVHLFKTAHHPRFVQDYRLPAVEVALATAAAPTYFPSFIGSNGMAHIDGGVWANCPATVAIIEALAILEKRPDEIDIVSIGATEEPFHVSPLRRSFGGLLFWNKGIVDLLMQAQVSGALAQAKVLTGRRAMRINAVASPGRFRLDDSRRIADLRALGIREARHHAEEIATRFLEQPANRFQPFYGLEDRACDSSAA